MTDIYKSIQIEYNYYFGINKEKEPNLYDILRNVREIKNATSTISNVKYRNMNNIVKQNVDIVCSKNKKYSICQDYAYKFWFLEQYHMWQFTKYLEDQIIADIKSEI